MDNTKNDHYYISKIQEDLLFIVEHMRDVDLEELASYELLQDSMLFRLIQISESAKQLSDDYKTQHPSVPWTAIYGLRNRIVHDYGSVDLTIVYNTLKTDIPELLRILETEL